MLQLFASHDSSLRLAFVRSDHETAMEWRDASSLRTSLRVVLVFLLATRILTPAVAAKPPNILFIFTDDQRNTTMGCSGHPVVRTPHVDSLATSGVRFENAFVSTSTCWVSRACLFTGCYERRHLYRKQPGPLDPDLCRSSHFSVLKAAGYRTGHLGKEHVTLSDVSAEEMFDVRRRLGRNPYFKEQPDGSQRHETDIIGDWACEFLDQQPSAKPFCLQLSFNAPHAEDGDRRPGIGHYPWPQSTDGMYEDQTMPLPRLRADSIYDAQPDFLKASINRQRFFWRWDTPEKYQTNMRAYLRMLSGIDNVVGRLRNKLSELGIADNTIIIYTADNGYYLGDRGFAGKWTHYEESLRVPLVIYDPRATQSNRGRVEPSMVLNSDLGPTIIDLAGLKAQSAHTGHSLLPLLQNQKPEGWRTDFLCEFLAVPATIPEWEGVRSDRWVYARYFVDGKDETPFEFLHDLQNDPDELVNLASTEESTSSPSVVEALQSMRKRCDELVARNGPSMKEILSESTASKKRPGKRSSK
ncbi:MAG: sulfatase [Planctomycetaceae bacterium]|nr:sulfatase [Planctomycetaceae bacterium]